MWKNKALLTILCRICKYRGAKKLNRRFWKKDEHLGLFRGAKFTRKNVLKKANYIWVDSNPVSYHSFENAIILPDTVGSHFGAVSNPLSCNPSLWSGRLSKTFSLSMTVLHLIIPCLIGFFPIQDRKYKEMKQRYSELYARLTHIKKLVVEYDQNQLQSVS